MKTKSLAIWKKIPVLLLASFLVFSFFTPMKINATEELGKGELVDLRAADITKPVIEKVEFTSAGTTVNAGDELPIYIEAYDIDSGIESIRVSIEYSGNDNNYISTTLTIDGNKENNQYEGLITVIDGAYTLGRITNVRAVDKSNNYKDYQFDNVNMSFNIENTTELEHGVVDSIDFPMNHKEIEKGNNLTFSITLSEKDTVRFGDYIYVDFYDGVENTIACVMIKQNGVYSCSVPIESFRKSGKYLLDDIYGDVQNTRVPIDFKDKDIWFQLTGEDDNILPQIESVKMDKENGSVLSAGDKVNFEVKASDDLGIKKEYAFINFSASADINDSWKTISLTYNENDDTFNGTFEVTENTYPCEWYLSDITIQDLSDNYVDFSDYANKTSNEFYFNVKKDGTFVTPTYDTEISFEAFDEEEGYYQEVSHFKKADIERRTTFKEAGVEFPKIADSSSGYKFVGWEDYSGKRYDENSAILGEHISLRAVYDKIIMPVFYSYPNKELNEVKQLNSFLVLSKGTTYKEAYLEAKKKSFNDIYDKQKFSWDIEDNDHINIDDEISDSLFLYLSASAKYEGHKVVSTSRYYFNKDARMLGDTKVKIVQNGTRYETLEKELSELKDPEMYKGLRFNKWNIYSSGSSPISKGEITEDYTNTQAVAIYENCIVRFILDEMYDIQTDLRGTGTSMSHEKDYDYVQAMVVEKGDRISIPKIEGYKNVKWIIPSKVEESFEVKDHMNFYGYGDKMDSPTPPEKPENPGKPVVPGKPAQKPSPEEVKETVSNIQNAKAGETVEVDMKNATVVPTEVLASAKGKNVNVQLKMNGYTWTINGLDIVASNLKDINLEVKFNEKAIPSKTINAMADNNPVKQLSLTHNGDFGFKANLTVNVGSEYKGKYGNLYYYNSDGKLVFMNAGKINENGDVTLSFSHASDYVIVMSDKIMDTAKSPETGDSTNANGLVILLTVSILAIALGVRRKYLVK